MVPLHTKKLYHINYFTQYCKNVNIIFGKSVTLLVVIFFLCVRIRGPCEKHRYQVLHSGWLFRWGVKTTMDFVNEGEKWQECSERVGYGWHSGTLLASYSSGINTMSVGVIHAVLLNWWSYRRQDRRCFSHSVLWIIHRIY